jgi:predicted nucleic acid-binding protein
MLDTDILIELKRDEPKALAWLDTLPDLPPVCIFAALELFWGCQNSQERRTVVKFLAPYTLIYPTESGLQQAMSLSPLKLSHSVSAMDALIAATALEHGLPLYTFNVKHFGAVPNLQIIVPYVR